MTRSADADTAVLVFARAPEPGAAKTRLIPAIGSDAAARLQSRLTIHALDTATGANAGDVQLWCTPSSRHAFFLNCLAGRKLSLHTQIGSTLGERLRHAHDAAFRSYRRVLFMGTDCPALTAHDLQAASAELVGSNALVIPAEDGGYVLLGLSQPCPAAFENIDWGGNRVLAQTLAQLQKAVSSSLVREPLWDVDRPEDFRRLAISMPHLAHDP